MGVSVAQLLITCFAYRRAQEQSLASPSRTQKRVLSETLECVYHVMCMPSLIATQTTGPLSLVLLSAIGSPGFPVGLVSVWRFAASQMGQWDNAVSHFPLAGFCLIIFLSLSF